MNFNYCPHFILFTFPLHPPHTQIHIYTQQQNKKNSVSSNPVHLSSLRPPLFRIFNNNNTNQKEIILYQQCTFFFVLL
eukprot:UN10967